MWKDLYSSFLSPRFRNTSKICFLWALFDYERKMNWFPLLCRLISLVRKEMSDFSNHRHVSWESTCTGKSPFFTDQFEQIRVVTQMVMQCLSYVQCGKSRMSLKPFIIFFFHFILWYYTRSDKTPKTWGTPIQILYC